MKILNFLFPITCVLCGKSGSYLCPHCVKTFTRPNLLTICHVCGRESRIGLCHKDCREYSFLDGHIYLFAYEGIIKELIMDIKFKNQYEIISTFAKIMIDFIKFFKFDNSWTITFVPSTKSKQNERGFNQSELLAKQISNRTKMPFLATLFKKNITHTQVGLGGEERRLNLIDSFTLNNEINLPAKLLIIDDVYTTGTTLNECAKVLKNNNVKTVVGLTIARSSR